MPGRPVAGASDHTGVSTCCLPYSGFLFHSSSLPRHPSVHAWCSSRIESLSAVGRPAQQRPRLPACDRQPGRRPGGQSRGRRTRIPQDRRPACCSVRYPGCRHRPIGNTSAATNRQADGHQAVGKRSGSGHVDEVLRRPRRLVIRADRCIPQAVALHLAARATSSTASTPDTGWPQAGRMPLAAAMTASGPHRRAARCSRGAITTRAGRRGQRPPGATGAVGSLITSRLPLACLSLCRPAFE